MGFGVNYIVVSGISRISLTDFFSPQCSISRIKPHSAFPANSSCMHMLLQCMCFYTLLHYLEKSILRTCFYHAYLLKSYKN